MDEQAEADARLGFRALAQMGAIPPALPAQEGEHMSIETIVYRQEAKIRQRAKELIDAGKCDRSDAYSTASSELQEEHATEVHIALGALSVAARDMSDDELAGWVSRT